MKKAAPWIVFLLLVTATGFWYFSSVPSPEAHPSVVPLLPVQVEEQPVPAITESPFIAQSPPTPAVELPLLKESDEEVAAGLARITGPELLGQVLVFEQIINRIVATVDSLDGRQLPPLILPVTPADGAFLVSGTDTVTVQTANAQRYEPYVRVAAAADSEELVEMYVTYYPLFQQAYVDLGYGDADFNDRLVEIIDHLLATPEPENEPVLIKSEAVYLFADPALEALSAGQKLLLRVGSSNTAIIKDKLSEIRAALARQLS